MAQSPLPRSAPSTTSIADPSRGDLVGRASAILARETPRLSRAGGSLTGAPGIPGIPSDSIGEIQARAMAVLSDFFSLLGAPAPGVGSLAAPLALEIPWHRPEVPVAAGGSTGLPLRLENLEDHPVRVSFYSSDLLSDSGASIPSFAVSFEPATLNLGSRQHAVVTANIHVPSQTIPGAYSGLVQAAGLAQVKAVITVEVD